MTDIVPGKIHLYVGDGKGKSTAAAGLALRCLGSGGTVVFAQFLKGRPTGELEPLERIGATVLRAKSSQKWLGEMSGEERREECLCHQSCLEQVRRILREGGVSLCVLDEVVDAVNCGLLELSRVVEVLGLCSTGADLVLTGRNPAEELANAADYHTIFQCVRHPYQKGLAARRGIEY